MWLTRWIMIDFVRGPFLCVAWYECTICSMVTPALKHNREQGRAKVVMRTKDCSIVKYAYLIAIHVNRTDVGGADSGEREEPVVPSTEVHGSLVEAEQSAQALCHRRVYAEQIACKVNFCYSVCDFRVPPQASQPENIRSRVSRLYRRSTAYI